MNSLPRIMLIVLLSIIISALYLAASEGDYQFDKNKDGKPDQWYIKNGNYICRIEVDSNFDGVVDIVTLYTKDGQKEKEEYDFNFDGKMDDFSFYEKGMLVRREMDSNYDEKPDVWVYLVKGIYVKKIEQDKDFDGKADYLKVY